MIYQREVVKLLYKLSLLLLVQTKLTQITKLTHDWITNKNFSPWYSSQLKTPHSAGRRQIDAVIGAFVTHGLPKKSKVFFIANRCCFIIDGGRSCTSLSGVVKKACKVRSLELKHVRDVYKD